MIRARELRFRYPGPGGYGLHVPAFDLAPGERVALIGPSGSGKTTLVSLLAGILTPSAGSLDVLGLDLRAASDAERRVQRIGRIGMIFQDFALLPYLDVRANILLPFAIHPALPLDAAAERRCADLAQTLGLEARLAAMPATLSTGEAQRVAIARALITAPPLVFGDEPTGNLDPARSRTVLTLILEQVAADPERAFLMVTHDHGLLEHFDRVVDLATMVEA